MEDYFDGSDRHDHWPLQVHPPRRRPLLLSQGALTAQCGGHGTYLHDASAATLEDAVRIMARYQLGKHLDGTEVSNIAAFLRTLTGEYQGKPLQ
jgi:hypothetical protein